jgi:serpin B
MVANRDDAPRSTVASNPTCGCRSLRRTAYRDRRGTRASRPTRDAGIRSVEHLEIHLAKRDLAIERIASADAVAPPRRSGYNAGRMSHAFRKPLLAAVALAVFNTGCPAGGGDAKTDAKTSDAKKTDAKKTDAKTDAKQPDTKTDAKQPDTKTDAKPEPDTKPEVPVDPAFEAALAKGLNAFAIDIHRELGAAPGNLFTSPASMALAFAMVHAGAKGATADEIAKAFHLPSGEALHPALKGTLSRWNAATGGLELAVANRLFGEKTVKFEAPYLALTGDVFAAPLEAMDFIGNSGAARTHINDWVATQTKDKIKDLIPPPGVTEATRLVLVNAIYFKAQWAEAFEASQTKDEPFVGEGKATVKMMHRVDQYQLGTAADAKARTIEIPYNGGEYSMVIVLPDDPKGLPAVEKALTAEALDGWLTSAKSTRVALGVPRFKIEPGEAIQLRKPLETLGVVTAWDASKADFTGMAPKDAQLVISDAFHKAFIAVDEAGTEAAAATAVSMRAGSAAPVDEPVPFVADHPFLFLIRDTKTGTILFLGRLVKPTDAK